jgi:hypothetical protein
MLCADLTEPRCAAIRRAIWAVCIATGLVGAARAQENEAPPDPVTFIENCAGDEAIELHAGTDSALLDEPDRAQIHSAMLARYKQLAADGFAPTAIVLWRSPSFGWIYLALKGQAGKPGKLCSAASFSAAQFELTGTLLRKYFLAGRT